METKKWYESLTIQASAIVAFLQIIPDIINQINTAVPSLGLSTNPIVMKVLTFIGVIVAIYGRFIAKTVVTK